VGRNETVVFGKEKSWIYRSFSADLRGITALWILSGGVSVMAQQCSPKLLEIYREPLKQGGEAAYRAIEEDTARITAEFNFPHPHPAIETLAGPKEVWWLNVWESRVERLKVSDEVTKNRPMAKAIERNSRRKQELTKRPTDIFLNYRADLSRGESWRLAGARFVVVAITKRDSLPEGSVFEAPEGTRFVVCAVHTYQEADALRVAAGSETRIFAVRPYWGMPAKEWIAADREFWKANPMARIR